VFFSTGECVYFSWQLYRNGNVCELGQDICSCGKRFSECLVWQEVVKHINNKVGYNLFDDPFKFKMATFKSPRHGQDLDFKGRLFRAILFRILQYYPATSFIKIFAQIVDRQLYHNWLFFDVISEVTKVTHVVDSSKDIIRALLLYFKRPGDLSIVLLIRDVEESAASAAKRDGDPIRAAKDWYKLYYRYWRILKKVRRRDKKLLRKTVQYEILANEPETIRHEIASFLGLPPPSSPLAIDTKKYHLIAGNPMRYKGKITIHYDNSWKTVLVPEVKRKVKEIKHKAEYIFDKLESLSC